MKKQDSPILEHSFYANEVVAIARNLLGKQLIRVENGEQTAGLIVETEAYDGEQDEACHARSGKTRRNAVMYGEAGHAYVYFTYGMHWMLNCVTGPEGYPAAVLIRAVVPLEGLDLIARRRQNIKPKHWCDGPAKLTRAFNIDGSFNGYDLCQPAGFLRLAEGVTIPDTQVHATPRIGIPYAGEPWKSHLWRFVVTGTQKFLIRQFNGSMI